MGDAMASPQDGPTRKQQKIRARRKLAAWRAKHPLKTSDAGTTGDKASAKPGR
jgi:hypothetical protein